MANLNPKTLREHEEFNPIRNLWRNVLIVAIEDVVKKTTVAARFKNYYSHAQQTALEYFTIPNQDFYDIWQFAEIDHTQVRKNVLKRVFFAVKNSKPDLVVRITGDCPLLDFRILDKMIELFLRKI